jgi:sugar phosphate isomerase/epimerase
MNKTVLAAQLYTLRDYLKTPADIAVTMKKVKQLGYDVVQTSGLGPIDPKELEKIVHNEGLTICATHIDYTRIRDNVQSVIDDHLLWECKYVGIGGLPQEYRNKDGYKKFAVECSAAVKKMSDNGLVFVYHNHSFELEKYDGRTGLDILFSESNPKLFNFEIDTYWIQHGGGDPADWIMKFGNRVPVIHLKDMVMHGFEQLMAEIGEGNLNWKTILDACKKNGVEWYIIEQDVCQRDPFESLSISLRNLHNMGLK